MINVLLIGCGNIAHHYASFFKREQVKFSIHGRSLNNTVSFASKYAVDSFTCEERDEAPVYEEFTHVILAAPIELLSSYVNRLKAFKHLQILCEKPGFLNWSELDSYQQCNNLWFAFNRRFYETTKKLKEYLELSSFLKIKVEFDERIFQVEQSKKIREVKDRWMLANSSHVIDLAFYLLDYNVDFKKFINGRMGGISWHPSGRFFHSSYLSDNIQLTFDSSWNGLGGWSVYVATEDSDYELKPLEKLIIQSKTGEFELNEPEEFKAGFASMLNSFLGSKNGLMTPRELIKLSSFIFDLAGYEKN